MIPVRLSLTNFMPYRAGVGPIDFASIHIASICGDNGSGKSSLIDAMTWALWGKSRAKSDDELIHQGEFSMEVIFDFTVSRQVYRIIRKRSRGKSKRSPGQSSLDLFIENDGIFKPITGDNIGATEKKIAEIIHMDYDTFINSAFLRQGHADQFTVAKPVDRKSVLTSILGLSTYDRLEQDARDFTSKRESTRLQLENNIRDIDGELSRKVSYEAEMAEAQNQLADVERAIAGLDSRLTQLRQEKELLSTKQAQVTQLDEQVNRMSRDLRRWQEQAGQYSLRILEYSRLIEKRQSIEDGYTRLISQRKLNDELGQKSRLVSSLRERQYQLEKTIQLASQPLLKEHTLTETLLNDLQAKFEKSTALRNEIQQVQSEMGRVSPVEETLAAMKTDYQNRITEIRQLESDHIRLENEITDISDKLMLLENEPGAKCPLCERELGTEHIHLIKEKYSREKQLKTESAKAAALRSAQKKTELAYLEKELNQTELQLNKTRTTLQTKIGLLERGLTEAEEAGRQIELQQAKLSDLEEHLAKKDYAVAEQAVWNRLDAEISGIAYDPGKHDQLRDELSRLTGEFEGPKHKLDEAERLIQEAAEAAASAGQAIKELQAGLAEYNNKKLNLTAELVAFPSVTAALIETENEYKTLDLRQKETRERLIIARAQLNRCAQLEKIRQDKSQQLQDSLVEEDIFRELSEAFGKKGVQALLIETALPEIEAEANRLLSRMTDNRLHVKFETQRETKKGDLLETLDITIADELGTRNYEMFSGGEAFRINFAIRVALSKVLARRAGAPLPTLIVDEGFGTQDASGMEKLREAITSVQDDFEKILVITHIEEFRDAFPVRIDVVKGPQGSTVEVS
jgi:DNA repair protein SbcC/Rad50